MTHEELLLVKAEFEASEHYKIPLNKYIEAIEKGYINPHFHHEYLPDLWNVSLEKISPYK